MRVRFGDLRAVTHAVTLPRPVAATAILAGVAEDLVRAVLRNHPEEREISLLAISVSHSRSGRWCNSICRSASPTRRAAPARRSGMARLLADRAIDAIRDRFGREPSATPRSPSIAASVPDAFRELAEREL